jgi:hypothetical protein
MVDTKTFNRYRPDSDLPPQYLCFSAKQDVEGAVFMRETATVNWFALTTLSPCTFSLVGNNQHYLDGWIKVDIDIEKIKMINSFKRVIDAYMDFCLNRNHTKDMPKRTMEMDVMLNEFLAKYVKLVEKS